jgi:undecaprenyl diphosphate synthase
MIRIPKHVAIILDGNGRWAKSQSLPRIAGHQAGIKTARAVIESAAKIGVSVLSYFVFSSENWQRPVEEVSSILDFFLRALQTDVNKLHQNNIRFRVIGDLSSFSEETQQHIHEAEALTAQNTGMTLVLAANYGGQWDITQAAQKLARLVAQGDLDPEAITPHLLEQQLTTSDLPAPDLFIRTSGEQRISNFFLWQLAYAELYFTPVHWPSFNEQELMKAITYYQTRERRFGKISEQLESIHA